jgi:hypothetical protein
VERRMGTPLELMCRWCRRCLMCATWLILSCISCEHRNPHGIQTAALRSTELHRGPNAHPARRRQFAHSTHHLQGRLSLATRYPRNSSCHQMRTCKATRATIVITQM